MPLGMMGFIADQYYLSGIRYNKLEYYQIAVKLFPFEKPFLIGEAEWYVHNKIVNQQSYLAVKDMVKYDPYRPRHVSLELQFAFILKDQNTVKDASERLKFLSPKLFNVIVKFNPSLR